MTAVDDGGDDGSLELKGELNSLPALKQRHETLRADMSAVEQERDRLAEEVAALRKQLAAAGKPAKVKLGAEDAFERKTVASYADVVDAIDWEVAGKSVVALRTQLPRLREPGASMDHDLMEAIQKHMIPLAQIAIELHSKGVPGSEPNRSFTHPAVEVSMIRATLTQAKLPLTEDQDARLVKLGDSFVSRDANRLAAYTDETPLQRLIDESRLKDSFFSEVDALLTEEQRNVLHPPTIRDWVGLDVFSSGVFWQGKVIAVVAASDAVLGAQITEQVAKHFGMNEEDKSVLEQRVSGWVGRLPEDAILRSTEGLQGSIPMKHLRALWAPCLALYADLVRSLPADSPALKKVNTTTSVVLPIVVGGS